MKIALATGNPGKVRELSEILRGAEIVGAPEGFDPAETGTTLFQNALIKARALRRLDRSDAFVVADDTGLSVRALGGRPGVFSARYAGPDATYEDNCLRLLQEMEDATDRSASFVSVLVALSSGDEMLVACGTCPGTIAPAQRGSGGFGYDPVFLPGGGDRSMAEMDLAEKNAISHRGKAARRLARMLGVDA